MAGALQSDVEQLYQKLLDMSWCLCFPHGCCCGYICTTWTISCPTLDVLFKKCAFTALVLLLMLAMLMASCFASRPGRIASIDAYMLVDVAQHLLPHVIAARVNRYMHPV